MIENTISREKARNLYDSIGVRSDWAEPFESKAKTRGLELLDLRPGLRVLNIGCGTGQEHFQIQARIGTGGTAVGLDLSQVMVALTRDRCGSLVIQADATYLPFAADRFDRIFSSYLLDLIHYEDLSHTLQEFLRVLCPGGRMVVDR